MHVNNIQQVIKVLVSPNLHRMHDYVPTISSMPIEVEANLAVIYEFQKHQNSTKYVVRIYIQLTLELFFFTALPFNSRRLARAASHIFL